MRSPLLLALLAAAAFIGCHREPPDITEAQAEALAFKEQPNWCNAEGFKCSDFRSIGKQPPPEPGWEWSWQWAAEQSERPVLLALVVDKKGQVAARIMAVPATGVPALTGVASAAKPPAAPAASTATAKSAATGAAPTPAPVTLAKAPAPPVSGAPALDPKDPKPRTPPPLDAVAVTPPPLATSPSGGESLVIEPTFDDVFRACETEIGILCLRSPSSVPQARNCLRPHRAALRAACGKLVGLKRSAFDED